MYISAADICKSDLILYEGYLHKVYGYKNKQYVFVGDLELSVEEINRKLDNGEALLLKADISTLVPILKKNRHLCKFSLSYDSLFFILSDILDINLEKGYKKFDRELLVGLGVRGAKNRSNILNCMRKL